jgi:hypothetical protein
MFSMNEDRKGNLPIGKVTKKAPDVGTLEESEAPYGFLQSFNTEAVKPPGAKSRR